VFHTDVVKVERMLQVHVLNVSSVIFRRCICFHTYNASVLSGYVAYVYNGLKCFLGIFASVLDARFNYFICFETYVAIVVSGCFKTRSSIAYPSSPFLLSRLSVRRGKAEAVLRGESGMDIVLPYLGPNPFRGV
jgi:hypothetical protein